MRGEKALQILECLAESAGHTFEKLTANLQGKDVALLEKLPEKWPSEVTSATYLIARERHRNLLRWLERDGMISSSWGQKENVLALTGKGERYLETLRKRKSEELPPAAYARQPSDRLMIIAFDVPEKDKRKRAWLRNALKEMGFRMIQKSVWSGRIRIPKEFIDDIAKHNISRFIEVFTAEKLGSLRQAVELSDKN